MNHELIEINLLPDDLRQKREIKLPSLNLKVILVGFAVVALLVGGYLYTFRLGEEIKDLNKKISKIKEENRGIERKVAVVDSSLRLKKKLESQIDSVEDLITESFFGIRLLETISLSVPSDVRLVSISENRVGDGVIQVTIEAQSFRNETVNLFMGSLESSKSFSDISLSYLSLTKIGDEDGFEFGLLMETNQSMSFDKGS